LLSIPSKNQHRFALQPNHYFSQQQFDKPKKTDVTRSKSFITRKKSPTKPLVFREDIAPVQNENHCTKSVSSSNGDEFDEK
jgi:hypothetical protein